MNFFYLDDNKKIVLGTTSSKNIDDVKYSVPNGKEFYLYKLNDDFQKILNTQQPAGIGKFLI